MDRMLPLYLEEGLGVCVSFKRIEASLEIVAALVLGLAEALLSLLMR